MPDELLVERIVGRRSDPETGAIYHLTFRPPPEDIVHRLVQRSDDTEEMVHGPAVWWQLIRLRGPCLAAHNLSASLLLSVSTSG